MKRLFSIILLFLSICVFYGCGSSSEKTVASKEPDEIALMCYAQVVLKDFFPGCEYAQDLDDYQSVGTGLRYKIEGDVAISENYKMERFYMIIQFTDEEYDTYDLISLQVGDDKIYDNGK